MDKIEKRSVLYLKTRRIKWGKKNPFKNKLSSTYKAKYFILKGVVIVRLSEKGLVLVVLDVC